MIDFHFVDHSRSDYDDMVRFCSRDVDLAREAANYRAFWICVQMGLEGRRRRLCQGEKVEVENDTTSLKCHHLHHDQPQLRLAPVKFEQVLILSVETCVLVLTIEFQVKTVPFVGIIVDIAYPDEMETVKEEARGKMITTTLVIESCSNMMVLFCSCRLTITVRLT